VKASRSSEPADAISSRERLLGTAKRLMAEAGYERVSTAAIAREAGTSESQLVRYFGSKAGLLETIFDESWAPLNPQIARLVAAATTAREAMITILSTMIGAFERDPDLAKLLLFEGRRVRGDNAEVLLTQGFRDFAKLVVSLIERGQKDGSFNTALKPQAITSALLGAAEGMMRDRLLATQQSQPSPFPDSQIRAVFGALVSGLGP
jgi:AcrR family transcriptional regulator